MKIASFAFSLTLLFSHPAASALQVNIDPASRIDSVPARGAAIASVGQTTQIDTVAAAVGEARRLIGLSDETADARYLGFAAGVLAPWNTSQDAPAEIRLLRAILAQKKHQFEVALSDLQPALQEPTLAAEAWFVKAMVHQAMGDHAKAIGSCYTLAQYTPAAVVSACLASEFSAMGQLELAAGMITDNPLDELQALDPAVQQWILTVYAEVAMTDNAALASEYFQRAVAISPQSSYLTRVYSQHLLAQQQAPAVLELLGRRSLDAPLLWLQCQALQKIGNKLEYRQCMDELVPQALSSDGSDGFLYPELVEQLGLEGHAITQPMEML